MRLTNTIAAGAIALTVPLYASTGMAAPLSHTMSAASAAERGVAVEHVQYRGNHARWNHGRNQGRWHGPAAGFAAGVIIGGAAASAAYGDGYVYGDGYSYAPGYDAYAAAPGVVVQPRRGWRDSGCTGDREHDSAYPSWSC